MPSPYCARFLGNIESLLACFFSGLSGCSGKIVAELTETSLGWKTQFQYTLTFTQRRLSEVAGTSAFRHCRSAEFLCARSTCRYGASCAAISGKDRGRRAIVNCARAAYRCAKRGTPASQPVAPDGRRRRRHWRLRYHCASSSTWDYRILLHHGRNSIHRTAGYVTRSSGGVGGRGRAASSYPD